MSDFHTTKNYFAHGGNELVIGGKLTFLTGATVEGGDGLFDAAGNGAADITPAAYQPDSEATTVAALKADLNTLLVSLRTAGLMVAAPAAEPEVPGQDDNGTGSGDEP